VVEAAGGIAGSASQLRKILAATWCACGLAKPGYINDEAGRRYALCHICYGLGRWEQSQMVARLRVSQAMIQLISTVASIRYIFEIRPMGT
jgi:hypothetical protein